jgi:branched-subunit amino acid ABC-type transport system permease component
VEYFLQQTINGITLGAVYGLIAIGYTMVYGIVGMINFAHGEIYMIGAFVAVIVFTLLGMMGVTWVPAAVASMFAPALVVVATATLESAGCTPGLTMLVTVKVVKTPVLTSVTEARVMVRTPAARAAVVPVPAQLTVQVATDALEP